MFLIIDYPSNQEWASLIKSEGVEINQANRWNVGHFLPTGGPRSANGGVGRSGQGSVHQL